MDIWWRGCGKTSTAQQSERSSYNSGFYNLMKWFSVEICFGQSIVENGYNFFFFELYRTFCFTIWIPAFQPLRDLRNNCYYRVQMLYIMHIYVHTGHDVSAVHVLMTWHLRVHTYEYGLRLIHRSILHTASTLLTRVWIHIYIYKSKCMYRCKYWWTNSKKARGVRITEG